jgi:Kunitz/Bovine pancreatic trypsin inhibitor domain
MSANKTLRYLLAAAVAVPLLALAACGSRSQKHDGEPAPSAAPPVQQGTGIDSESHFLSLCAEGCGDGFRCVCGVCTQLCDETPDCSELGASVECALPTPANPDSCRGQLVHKVCDRHCESSSDCGLGAVCSGGACRRAPLPSESCPAQATPACSETEELHSQTVEGCLELSCVPKSVCRLPFWEPGARQCRAQETPRYWFDATRGRCEVQYTGGCGETQNAFSSEQECWQACMPEYAGQCLETWNARWDTAEFTPSALLPAEPIVLSHAAADQLVQAEYRATLTYPDQTQTELTLLLSDVTAYWVTRQANPQASQNDLLLLPSPGEIPCPNAILVEADARFTTTDGRFDESWPRAQLALGQRDAKGGIEIWIPGDWSEARSDEPVLQGSYRPALTSEQCVLQSRLSLTLVDGAVSGSLSHDVLDLPCSEVTLNTPISQPTIPPGPPPMLPQSPAGPGWSTLVTDPYALFCSAASPNSAGPDELAANAEVYRARYDDPEPESLVFSEVLADCTEADFDHCTPEGLLTLTAAECIARASGFAPGLVAWQTGLGLSSEHGKPTWTVRNTLSQDAGGNASGDQLELDAATGEILTTLGWQDGDDAGLASEP